MDSPLGEYLRVRRAALRPEDVGLRTMPGRRVAGLRRDEVAELAGISPEYYLRLEQGRGHQPSDQVLRSLSRALRLDANAEQYLARLVDIQSDGRRTTAPAQLPSGLAAGLTGLIDGWHSTPAYLTDRNQTVLLHNDLARDVLPGGLQPGVNLMLRVFSPEWRASDAAWEHTASRAVAALRFHGDPADPRFRDLVGLLSMRDADFRRLWALHHAAPMGAADLRMDVVGFGRVEFAQQTLKPAGDENHVLTILHADPGSMAEDVLRALRLARGSEPVRERRAG